MDIRELTFSYNQKVWHLDKVTATVKPGKVTTIIGPNGSGKSTLLQAMSRNLTPDGGQIIVDGQAICDYSPKAFAKKIAVVHQQNIAPADITVEKLVSYGRIPHKRLFQNKKEEDQVAIDWALSCTQLTEKRETLVHQLSGGERQRVWIAMALAQKTPILFLDEPTTYLDMYHQFEILELVQTLNRKHQMTIVMVLHDLNQAIRYSDHLLVMKQGKLFMQGTPKDVICERSVKEIYDVDVVVKEDSQTGLYIVPVGI
ncbi:ABC transporter ATP-binding protein [Halalkalibacterium halodurans]|uniref:Ferrichrome ABC transporter (ATP-binding protein) n=1 Tax=Halalkalibacterium halodurans (strain ATCC BAA-125 / DSM 18197 / FERM 7344 / JCM 9153 / C-125) TaxID=272558 RepID=Q9K7R4_HALH5|nr:ABC transporter ATP-binding protein [Halalkalibacterium halodurans]MDY7223829.1 ABC transporter ATP-binding protein [Halalkalibacterium halodurans]MDY7243050.1 ABC transporter ATP-binding protein [Halalkalibacterium halodurans]MED4125685.1 ABC transporter ATP-binding protein [Halalkalibacterium halodurans]MED4174401.1 ABC transporter ATP-binding protein [Halalkalibacterium halodurans]BAB07014.1 ferrichrome ABC transporter (ATP-binding protein) [Halalkalibacterium halodurans C-125]